ncbi:hypothetical protein AU255_07085 [Methyloprofundus sedimenti]|uniref:Uncharacterized protein n=1 Tax=Methyloprofundus sedimenti TaxID=1420851 RepID=A0A1V8M8A7_9GAMM|nr:hypothetical protein AU255_07085 [Methyloprofundus sedimenti]
MILKLKQLQNFMRINRIGFCGCGKDFFKASKFEVIDVVKLISVPLDLAIQRASATIVAFNRDIYG